MTHKQFLALITQLFVGVYLWIKTPLDIALSNTESTPPAAQAIQLALGEEFTCVSQNGKIKCTGFADFGVSGKSTPYADFKLLKKFDDISLLAAGYRHLCFQNSGVVHCLGLRHNSGKHKTTNNSSPSEINETEIVEGLTSVDQLAAGFDHTCALKGGKVFCFGSNRFGQIGPGTHVGQRAWNFTPKEVAGLKGIVEISAGLFHTCARTKTKVFCFGLNEHGQLGRDEGAGTDDPQPEPLPVDGLDQVTSVATGEKHTCVVNSHRVFCFGSNEEGQRGVKSNFGKNRFEYQPKRVRGLLGTSQISASGKHTCALLNSEVYCFGYSYYGQSGSVLNAFFSTPFKVESLNYVEELAIGPQHTCARSEGSVYCFGRNWYGQLGVADLLKWSAQPIKLHLK